MLVIGYAAPLMVHQLNPSTAALSLAKIISKVSSGAGGARVQDVKQHSIALLHLNRLSMAYGLWDGVEFLLASPQPQGGRPRYLTALPPA